jgi:hypothetical protein
MQSRIETFNLGTYDLDARASTAHGTHGGRKIKSDRLPHAKCAMYVRVCADGVCLFVYVCAIGQEKTTRVKQNKTHTKQTNKLEIEQTNNCYVSRCIPRRLEAHPPL